MVINPQLHQYIIAVTGSAGKTTTKELIAAVLAQRWRTFKTYGNMNSCIGTAKSIKMIRPSHRAVVLEFGMRASGVIRRHCKLIRPDIGVITNVGTAHIGNFGGDIRKVAFAKSELIHNMRQNGSLFLNADDVNSDYLRTKGFQGKIITVGTKENADYKAQNIMSTPGGTFFTVNLTGTPYKFFIPMLGYHNIYNALFAVAIGYSFGLSANQIAKGLRSAKKLPRRLHVYRLAQGIQVIDDTFSANPIAVKAALDVLANKGGRRKIAVLGSMQELGNISIQAHRSIGAYAARKNLHYIFTYGREAKWIQKGAIEAGFAPTRAAHFISREKLHRHLVRVVQPHSTILVKGSHAIQMNKTVNYLRNHY